MNRLRISAFKAKVSSASLLTLRKRRNRSFSTQSDPKAAKELETPTTKDPLTKDANSVIKSEEDFLSSLKQGIESKISIWTLNTFNSILDYKMQNKADLGWLQKTHPLPPVNITAKFDDVVGSIQRQESHVMNASAEMADSVYCFVGGLWSNLAPLWFRTAMVRFEQLGLQSEQAVIDTSAGIRSNVVLLREAIPLLRKKHGKRIVLIGHSKGGVDSLSCLLMHPELQDDVKALITVQSPIGGSVLADDFLNSSSVGRSLLDMMFVKHVSGDYRCILDLTIAERKKMLEEFPLHKRLRVPMLNFASHISSVHNNIYYRGLYDYSKANYGLEGDGFVAVNDAIVPAYPFVNTPGVSHIGTGSMLGVQFGQERLPAADIHHALAILVQDVIKSHPTNP